MRRLAPLRHAILTVALLACVENLNASEPFTPLPNPDFDDAPAAWKLSGGQGRWADRGMLEVDGSGDDSNYWRCDYRFTPGRLYHFRMRARHVGGSGSSIAGPAFANRDSQLTSDWQWVDHVFHVPENIDDSYLRLGQWHATGTIQYDAVRLLPAMPVHKAVGKLVLGEGEMIRNGRYTFSATFDGQGSNYHRPLVSSTASFNSDRWWLNAGRQITYRFELPDHRLLSGKVGFNVNYHVRGVCQAEISRDGNDWTPLVTQDKVGTAEATLPADLLPAETMFLRLSAPESNTSLQVNRLEFAAQLTKTPPDVVGETMFADIEDELLKLKVERVVVKENLLSGGRMLLVTVRNTQDYHILADLRTTLEGTSEATRLMFEWVRWLDLPPGESTTGEVWLHELQSGENQLTLLLLRKTLLLDSHKPPETGRISLTYRVPEYYRSDYGQMLDASSKKAFLWSCPATHKIPRRRELPGTDFVAPARLSAARNDREAVQLVVRPTKHLKGLTATAGPFTGPEGATIPADNVQVLRVAYHFVHHATDKTGVVDDWPDALPPLNRPIDLPAGENQPLWVLVHVPKDAKAGDYTGNVSLKSDGFSADVPIKLHVWNFTLPDRNHIETAFGFSAGNVFRYHGLKTEEDKRRVLDMYFQNFAEHRISPYDPTPLDRIGVRFLPNENPPRAELDFSAFDAAMARAVDKYHFTGYRLPVQGMGGGTFHARSEPKIGDFGEDSPEYKAMFGSYVKQLEDHLREKGWLDLAYVYWFDEPAPKDFGFVANGMRRLKQYAPGLRRMLTEESGDNLLTGLVDIWCPVSHNYEHEAANGRRAHGERFWWYVCTGPKAPYCTLFIDHPATELRTWLWQSWQRDVTGVLVWSSNYWTSTAAFPDPAKPQNPYEDPMGYRSGYSTPKGVKAFWGNGDGRFLYPPEAAAVPGLSGDKPVIEPPVSSIRWEMLREGIEDYEYLYMLRDLLQKRGKELSAEQRGKFEALLEVPESITRDMTTFTTDPTPIYERRAAIAEAIERIGEQ
ncbi:MAG: glycoside hydrolase domain-containing protein [Thermoguttaceae bacterium]